MYRIPFIFLLNFVSPELISDHGGANDKCPACLVPRRSSLFDQNAKHSVGERLPRVRTQNHFALSDRLSPYLLSFFSFVVQTPSVSNVSRRYRATRTERKPIRLSRLGLDKLIGIKVDKRARRCAI